MTSLRVRRLRATSRGRRVALLASLAGLLFGTVVTAAPSVAEQPITPTSIIVEVFTNTQDVGGSDPFVLAEVDNQDPNLHEDELSVRLTLQPAGATFNSDTTVKLTVGGLGTGTFSPSSVIFHRDLPSEVFTGITYNKVESGITMLASAGKGQKAISSTNEPTNIFDIQYDVILQDATQNNVTLGADTCTRASVTLCAVVLLPNGVPSRTALATGACTTYYIGCTRTDGRIVSFMADLNLIDPDTGLPFYDNANPVTILMRCDKAYCKGGGVSSYTLLRWADWGSLTFEETPACQVKGQVQAGEDNCVDYVQSHRDNAGDLILYWLVATDPRGTM